MHATEYNVHACELECIVIKVGDRCCLHSHLHYSYIIHFDMCTVDPRISEHDMQNQEVTCGLFYVIPICMSFIYLRVSCSLHCSLSSL